MKEPRLLFDPNPPRSWLDTVERRLESYNIAATGFCDYYPVSVLIDGRSNSVLGGVYGNVWGGWLHVRWLWVDGRLRRRGYATRLVAAAESYARSKASVGAFLSTASYEARPFYEKLGYRVYAALAEHPLRGHSRFFMSRLFGPGEADESRSDDGSIRLEPYPSPETVDLLRRGIAAHAASALGLPERSVRPSYFFLSDDYGEILGGALGNTWGLWLFTSHLWVDRSLRRRGLASRLMTTAEDEARRRGCVSAFLDTFSFNPLMLYQQLGYRVFGELRDHPQGHNHYFMSKRLK